MTTKPNPASRQHKEQQNCYVSLLRGINVGGHNKIPMTDLKNLYAALGFKQISTYIQSGNVVFEAECTLQEAEKTLAQTIQQAIMQQFNCKVPVVIRSGAALSTFAAQNPFLAHTPDPDHLIANLHAIFLADLPNSTLIEKAIAAAASLPTSSQDKFVVVGADIYLYCAGKYSDSKLSNAFFEAQFQTSATTRNWKTVQQLAQMVGNCC